MPKIERKNLKIFAEDAANNGQFGSAQVGTKVTSSDPEILQALSAWKEGWTRATIGGSKLPTLEELQTITYIPTYHLAYLLQEGLAEYNSETTYHIGSWVKSEGRVYASLIDDNTGNDLTDSSSWKLQEVEDEKIKLVNKDGIPPIPLNWRISSNQTIPDEEIFGYVGLLSSSERLEFNAVREDEQEFGIDNNAMILTYEAGDLLSAKIEIFNRNMSTLLGTTGEVHDVIFEMGTHMVGTVSYSIEGITLRSTGEDFKPRIDELERSVWILVTLGDGNNVVPKDRIFDVFTIYDPDTDSSYYGIKPDKLDLDSLAKDLPLLETTAQWSQDPVNIGFEAGKNKTSSRNIAIGFNAARDGQSEGGISIGSLAGNINQNYYAIAVGGNAGKTRQGEGAIALGVSSGELNQGSSSVAIGYRAGATSQPKDSIIINAGESKLNATAEKSITMGQADFTVKIGNGSVQSVSDRRDKYDIKESPLGLDFINDLKPKFFKYDIRELYEESNNEGKVIKNTPDRTKAGKRYHSGFIAQEVHETMDKFGVDFGVYCDQEVNATEDQKENAKDKVHLCYNEFIAIQAKAIQELSAKVDALEAKLGH